MGGTFIMDKCPFCGAETRPGDNFCLNCGNRLLSATPSSSDPQQAQPMVGGDSTLAAPDDWGSAVAPEGGTTPASGWGNDSATVASSNDQATQRPDSAQSSTNNGIEQPARFILRSENGDVLQEYPL